MNKKGKATKQNSVKNTVSDLVNQKLIEQIAANLLNNDDSDSDSEMMDVPASAPSKSTPSGKQPKNQGEKRVQVTGCYS